MEVKAFLKIHRTDPASVLCLRFWLETFKTYDTYILCDRYNPNTEPAPDWLKTALIDYKVTVVNSDYSIGETFCQNLKGAKRGMASANMTAFKHVNKHQGFWMIDADDTLFLTRDFDGIREKLKAAEHYLITNGLDGFSLDFYRNLNNGWTFGVCLLKGSMDWQKIKDVDMGPMVDLGFARNIDTAFDSMSRAGTIKLANFVFDRYAFQHQCNNYPDMPHGIYTWHRGKLWDKPLQSDVISL
jgi:hypothetical protein